MQEFLENVSRYPRYLITFTLGIFFSVFGWLRPLLRNRVSAIALLGIVISGLCFMVLTLRAMLGLSTL